MRAVLNREAVVRLRVEDEGGTLVAATSTPALTVTKVDGTSVTPGSVTAESTGVYVATIPPQAALDVLTCNWSYAVSGNTRSYTEKVAIVRDRVAPLWAFREDPELAELSTTAFLRVVERVEDWFEDALNFPIADRWFTRTWRVRRPTTGLVIPQVPFPKTITAVTVNDTAFTAADLTDLDIVRNTVERGVTGNPFLTGVSHPWMDGQYTVTGTCGPPEDWNARCPEDLQRAAVILARYLSRGSNYPERARQVLTDGANIILSTPSADRPTGLPDVDGVVARYRLTVTV